MYTARETPILVLMFTTKATKASADRLSYDLLGAAIEAHRHLGPGLLESAYESCLCRELCLRGIDYERQVSLPLEYGGTPWAVTTVSI